MDKGQLLLDQLARNIQTALGYRFTHNLQKLLGKKGRRFMRELLGRTARHRVQIGRTKESVGNALDGWVVCPDTLKRGGVCYSLGVGEDISFDLDLIRKFDVEVFAFDPTPASVAWMKSRELPSQFYFLRYGIADFDGISRFHQHNGIQFGLQAISETNTVSIDLEVRRLSTIMEQLGHEKINLVKINIEGGEYSVIKDMLASNVQADQVLVEFHHRLPGFTLSQTKQIVSDLNNHGYKIFHIADNGRTYSFIRAGTKEI